MGRAARTVDPQKILRMKHKVEVEVDLLKDSGNEGLALLIEGLPQKGTARQTLEYVVQGFVDTGFAEMSSDASRAELADLEAKLNQKREAMGKERIDFEAPEESLCADMRVTLKVDGEDHEATAQLLVKIDDVPLADVFVGHLGENSEDANLVRDLAFFLEIPEWLRRAHSLGALGGRFYLDSPAEEEVP